MTRRPELERPDQMLMPQLQRSIDDVHRRHLEPAEQHFLASAERWGIPCVRPDTARTLRMLARVHQPQRILEIGAGTGYAAWSMLRGAPDARYIGLEKNAERARIARQNLHQLLEIPGSNWCVQHGDAAIWLQQNHEPFDFVFVDGVKKEIARDIVLPACNRRALILVDNVLSRGMHSWERAQLPRRLAPGIQHCSQLLDQLMALPGYDSALLPVGDGLLILTPLQAPGHWQG